MVVVESDIGQVQRVVEACSTIVCSVGGMGLRFAAEVVFRRRVGMGGSRSLQRRVAARMFHSGEPGWIARVERQSQRFFDGVSGEAGGLPGTVKHHPVRRKWGEMRVSFALRCLHLQCSSVGMCES